MKLCIRLLLIVIWGSATQASFAALFEDNFDTNSLAGPNWGPVNNLGSAGNLTVVNGKLQYTTTNAADNFAAVNWNTSDQDLASSWTFTIDLSLAALSLADTNQLLLGLEAVDAGGKATLGFDSLVGTSTGTTRSIVGQDETGKQSAVDCTPPGVCGSTINLRMVYDGATGTLTTQVDPDGGSNSFTTLATTAPGFVPKALFVFGQSSGIKVLDAQATVDNVKTTLPPIAVPEPGQFAFLVAGIALLLLVAARRGVKLQHVASRVEGLR